MHKPTNKAAVDEGRDPYGKPGRGNMHDGWTIFLHVPCSICGSTKKELKIDGDVLTITCKGQHA